MNAIHRFFHAEEAATTVEYAVMLALIIAVCIAAIGSLGDSARLMWNDNSSQLNSAW